MKPILVLRHIACEGPGYLEQVFKRHNIPLQMIHIDENQSVPDSLQDFAALVLMGGPMSANDDLPWIGQELALIRQADASGMPVLGHCLGGQLISKALGGEISRNPVKEIGWLPVTQYENALANEWFGKTMTFDAFHWHGETFSIPQGATPLLQSEYCANQAFAKGNILALQCHLEITAEQVPIWATEYADEISVPSDSIQSRATMQYDLAHRIRVLQAIADDTYERWLQPLLQA